MSTAKERELARIAADFQKKMQKLGLGVTIQAADQAPTRITTWCPACNHVAPGSVSVCPNCDEAIPDA